MSDDAQVLDADVVDDHGTDLVQHQGAALFHTDDPVEVLEKATRVANALKNAVDRQGMIQKIQGKDYAKVEAWQTLGSMLGATAVCVHTEPTTDRHGKPAYKATVEARFHGQVIGQADALCSTSEGRWKNADDYAVLSMAQTRATSKALKGPLGWVMKLAGYESTPAEEMPRDAQDQAPANPLADDASQQLKTQASSALTYLMANDPGAAEKVWGELKTICGGVMPGAAAMALVCVARAVKAQHEESQS